MGREIEIKIPLNEEEFSLMENIFISQTHSVDGIQVVEANPNFITKRDEYFSKYNSRQERIDGGEPQVIRLRTEVMGSEEKAFFTIKTKSLENGIELNKEDETFLENPEVLREFFQVAGYHCWFDKTKIARGCYCDSSVMEGVRFHVELEKVNNLPYLEIEVTQNEGAAAAIKQALFDFIQLLGISPDRKDSRSWVEILMR